MFFHVMFASLIIFLYTISSSELGDSLVHIERLIPNLSVGQIYSWFHETDEIHLNTLKYTWLQNLDWIYKKISLVN